MTSIYHRTSLSIGHMLILCTAAFLIRAAVMHFCVAPYGFYKQPDSGDYHMASLCITIGNGMHRPDNNEPIFWRTPGYPLCLSFFYWLYELRGGSFEDNSHAQHACIWFQIVLSSLIPLLLFALAWVMTKNYFIACISAWISAIHPGFIFASTFLLTEGLALFFFYLFLICFFALLRTKKQIQGWFLIIFAALNLSIYTWMRPMGEFVAIFTALLLAIGIQESWKKSILKATCFLIVFFATLAPWYIRNHGLTDEWFFCPTIGTYLNVFSVPKILRRTTGKSLLECHQIARQKATIETRRKMSLLPPGKYVSNTICKRVAYPIVAQHPFYFAYDWMMECIKTTYDLYSYQMVSMANGSYFYDPIEEFLSDKIAACLYQEPGLPWYARIACWLEFIFQILLWIGIFGGLWMFVLHASTLRQLWLITFTLIGLVIGMTGGFGYARLRLPIEPLIIILSLTFFIKNNRKGNS